MEESQRVPLSTKDMNVCGSGSDTDSSDSNNSPPKVRKTRSTRTVRRTDSETAPLSVPVNPAICRKQVSVYTTRVTKCLDDFKSGRFHPCIDKNDDQSIATKKEAAPTVSPSNRKVRTRRDVVIVTSDKEDEDPDSSIITTPESSFVRSRSPTPPPVPGSSQPQKPVRKRRLNRNLQRALRHLEGMKDTMQDEREASSEDDSDILLISSFSSPMSETKDVTVKVRYHSHIYKYTMHKVDCFYTIKSKLARDISEDDDTLFFILGERNILPTDTPKSISLHIADIIDCHKYSQGTTDDLEEDIPARDALSLFVQSRDKKNKILIKVNKHDPLKKLMTLYAIKVKTELSYLKFMFDGEDVHPSTTAEDLDMEENDTIDAVDVL